MNTQIKLGTIMIDGEIRPYDQSVTRVYVDPGYDHCAFCILNNNSISLHTISRNGFELPKWINLIVKFVNSIKISEHCVVHIEAYDPRMATVNGTKTMYAMGAILAVTNNFPQFIVNNPFWRAWNSKRIMGKWLPSKTLPQPDFSKGDHEFDALKFMLGVEYYAHVHSKKRENK